MPGINKRVLTTSSVNIIVKDSTEEEYISDLRTKCREVASQLSRKDLYMKQGPITRALIKQYLETIGMVAGADSSETSNSFYFKSAVVLDVINRILDEAGVKLKANVAPCSAMAEFYNSLFNGKK